MYQVRERPGAWRWQAQRHRHHVPPAGDDHSVFHLESETAIFYTLLGPQLTRHSVLQQLPGSMVDDINDWFTFSFHLCAVRKEGRSTADRQLCRHCIQVLQGWLRPPICICTVLLDEQSRAEYLLRQLAKDCTGYPDDMLRHIPGPHPGRRRWRRRARSCATCTRPRTQRAATTARRAWSTSGEQLQCLNPTITWSAAACRCLLSPTVQVSAVSPCSPCSVQQRHDMQSCCVVAQVPAERREDVRVAVPPAEGQPAAAGGPLPPEDGVRRCF